MFAAKNSLEKKICATDVVRNDQIRKLHRTTSHRRNIHAAMLSFHVLPDENLAKDAHQWQPANDPKLDLVPETTVQLESFPYS